jgi:hypothetical protein
MAAVTATVACGGTSQQETPGQGAPAATAPATPAAGASEALDIAFTSNPAPPKTGENTFEVMVMGANGQPVTGADVAVEFYMAAMPSMNMPEMRNRVALTHEGAGRYRGTGHVMTAGRWDVTVTVSRDGQEIGRKTLSIGAQEHRCDRGGEQR